MNKTTFWFPVICTFSLLGACGGASDIKPGAFDEMIKHAAPESASSYSVAFLGNSITQHAPWPKIGWDGNYGMAASKRDLDYAHQVIARLGIAEQDAYIRNLYPLERDATTLDEVMETLAVGLKADVVVIQLGDNTDPALPGHLEALDVTMSRLTASVGPKTRLLCTTTFWREPRVDAIISDRCKAAGGTVVGIGDIYVQQESHSSQTYADYSVNRHPKDWAMTQIADRLVANIPQASLPVPGVASDKHQEANLSPLHSRGHSAQVDIDALASMLPGYAMRPCTRNQ